MPDINKQLLKIALPALKRIEYRLFKHYEDGSCWIPDTPDNRSLWRKMYIAHWGDEPLIEPKSVQGFIGVSEIVLLSNLADELRKVITNEANA